MATPQLVLPRLNSWLTGGSCGGFLRLVHFAPVDFQIRERRKNVVGMGKGECLVS